MITTILSKRARSLAPALLGAAIMLGAVPAAASAACEAGPQSQPFARFGDASSYEAVAGGSFEGSTSGWSLSGASVAAGNESYAVAGGSHSLAIAPGGVAVSPAFCVSTAKPTLRFFARQTSGSWGVLIVALRWSDGSGHTNETTLGAVQGASAWSPSGALQLATTLPLWQSAQTLQASIVFRAEQYGGAFAIDDVYVDPRMS